MYSVTSPYSVTKPLRVQKDIINKFQIHLQNEFSTIEQFESNDDVEDINNNIMTPQRESDKEHRSAKPQKQHILCGYFKKLKKKRRKIPYPK